jgi:hypothetical protein
VERVEGGCKWGGEGAARKGGGEGRPSKGEGEWRARKGENRANQRGRPPRVFLWEKRNDASDDF